MGDSLPVQSFVFVPEDRREVLAFVGLRPDLAGELWVYAVSPLDSDGEIECSAARKGTVPLDVAIEAALATEPFECSRIVADGADLKPVRASCAP